ncbi:hypothetical protein T4B_248 [Trichinella pseudospiralis]|uniref:Uncharacterized protein n=1 Tax=Trichinella pseudospiralis TaxID=6337 RepID=A0A0V1HWV8_TRIPS|nr:hypothetical protein T4B_248 [Trichinella pseudospiralis]KRZ45267.1 hypothetical protein T4C_6482 [Trichinella pseudospiralis]
MLSSNRFKNDQIEHVTQLYATNFQLQYVFGMQKFGREFFDFQKFRYFKIFAFFKILEFFYKN